MHFILHSYVISPEQEIFTLRAKSHFGNFHNIVVIINRFLVHIIKINDQPIVYLHFNRWLQDHTV